MFSISTSGLVFFGVFAIFPFEALAGTRPCAGEIQLFYCGNTRESLAICSLPPRVSTDPPSLRMEWRGRNRKASVVTVANSSLTTGDLFIEGAHHTYSELEFLGNSGRYTLASDGGDGSKLLPEVSLSFSSSRGLFSLFTCHSKGVLDRLSELADKIPTTRL